MISGAAVSRADVDWAASSKRACLIINDTAGAIRVPFLCLAAGLVFSSILRVNRVLAE